MEKTPLDQSLKDRFLQVVQEERVPVSIYLVNGIKLQGHIESADDVVIMLTNNSSSQIVFKHAVSTIVPSKEIKLES